MMAEKDLLNFREDWLSEITKTNKKRKIKIKETDKNVNKQKTASQGDSSNSKSNNPIPEKKCFTAFTIANDYLNTKAKKCTFCDVEAIRKRKCTCDVTSKRSNKSDVKITCKQYKQSSDRQKFYNSGDTNKADNDENLVDLLIADIDEINCVPFFDMELPKEIALKIFAFLSVKDLMHCSQVNTKWKVIAEDDLLWYKLCGELDVNISDTTCVQDRVGWKIFVKDSVTEKRRVQRKWKERFCEVRDLEYEKGIVILF